MACFTCNRSPFGSLGSTALGSSFAALSRAAAKSAASRLRKLGALTVAPDWAQRSAVCEQCPLRVVQGGVSYCGKPFLSRITREPAEGCGCPTREKARSPDEHCPLDERNCPAVRDENRCNCKWCVEEA